MVRLAFKCVFGAKFTGANGFNLRSQIETEYRSSLIPANKSTISRLESTKYSDLYDIIPYPLFYCVSFLKQKQFTKSFQAHFQCINPLNPKIKIKILICRPYSFTIEVVGRS